MSFYQQTKKYFQDLYESYDPDNPWALRQFSGHLDEDGIIKLIDDILEQPELLEEIGRRSYRHANGFDKIVLMNDKEQGWKYRLHVWQPGNSASEDLHEHRWNFASQMLSGMYHNWERYQHFGLEESDFSPKQLNVINSIQGKMDGLAEDYSAEIRGKLNNQDTIEDGINAILEKLRLEDTPDTRKELANDIENYIDMYAQEMAIEAMRPLFDRIQLMRLMHINDAVNMSMLGGKDAVAAQARPEDLCKELDVTMDDMEEFYTLYFLYDLPSVKDGAQEPEFAGYAHMEGPFISCVFEGENRLQPQWLAHRLVIEPAISGLTSTVIFTEAPREESSQMLQNHLVPKGDTKYERPHMRPEQLKETLTQYRSFLVVRQAVRGLMEELAEGEKPETSRMQGADEHPAFYGVQFMPLLRELLEQKEEGRLNQQYEEILESFERRVKSVGGEEALRLELGRNQRHFEEGHLSFGQTLENYDYLNAINYVRHALQLAERYDLTDKLLEIKDHGMTAESVQEIEELLREKQPLQSMELLWYMNELAQLHDNVLQAWEDYFVNQVQHFLIGGREVPQEEAELLLDQIDGSIFTGMQDALKDKLSKTLRANHGLELDEGRTLAHPGSNTNSRIGFIGKLRYNVEIGFDHEDDMASFVERVMRGGDNNGPRQL